MAPKRSAPLGAPPAESSDEDEATCSEEEEDAEKEQSSASEEEQTQNPKKRLSPSPLPKQTQTAKAAAKKPNPVTEEADSDSGSESESESETGSESDSDDGPISNVKPITSKPMEGTLSKTTKSNSKPSASPVAPGKSTAKRGNEVETDTKETKRAKRDSESNEVADKSEDAKKQLFQRLWSEEDEIVILKGMIDFTEEKGIDPTKDMNSFFDFIKKNLHVNVSVSQLKDKVTRLKKRFDNHKGKIGESKTCSKPHDQKLFELSKKIWGSEGICGFAKTNGKASKNNNARGKSLAALKAELGLDVEESEKVDTGDVKTENHLGLIGKTQFDKRVDMQRMQEYVIERGLDMVGGAKKAEMEEKWRNLHVAQLELFVKFNKLIGEQAELMLAGYKSMED